MCLASSVSRRMSSGGGYSLIRVDSFYRSIGVVRDIHPLTKALFLMTEFSALQTTT